MPARSKVTVRPARRGSASNGVGASAQIEESEAADAISYGPLHTLLGYQVREAYSRFFQSFNVSLQEVGLAPAQYGVLLLIGLNPGSSQMALAGAGEVDPATMVSITNRFAKLGWIEPTRSSEDRRVYSLRLTAAGQAVLDRVRPLIEMHEEQFLAGLGRTERAMAARLLERIADAESREMDANSVGGARVSTSRITRPSLKKSFTRTKGRKESAE